MSGEQQLIILRGPSGSGKSTRAAEILSNPRFKRLNKDLMRLMLDNGQYSYDNENLLKSLYDILLIQLLDRNFNVVIDDTNLRVSDVEHYIDLVADMKGLTVTVIDLTAWVDRTQCIERDAGRKGSAMVGSEIIMAQFDRYEPYTG